MIPNSDTIIQEGDVVYIAAEIAALSQFDAGLAPTQNGKGH
jgi:Trk K+ transport system NAD-binding subunit